MIKQSLIVRERGRRILSLFVTLYLFPSIYFLYAKKKGKKQKQKKKPIQILRKHSLDPHTHFYIYIIFIWTFIKK
ncbi:hypothetical protein J3Q64DRAFT_1239738 [Phycomyces blakesleeanus]|uniref:Uncharacterized protein n=1 Tax=Phycomyces blakesleeanus TaxID=4837 RepID=A0ABR3BE96_PHYBL